MTDDERRIAKLIHTQLGSNGAYLQDLVVLDMSMMGDSFFAEVVLNDGSKTSVVENEMKSLQSSLHAKGVRLDLRVAAKWTLESVEYGGICRGENGSIRMAEAFRAELLAGNARQTVIIEVSHGALSVFKERVGTTKAQGAEHLNALVCEILRDEINDWLSRGGESRWNPVATNVIQLDYLPSQRHTA